MSNPAELLLRSDPKLFMAVVHEQDPEKRALSLHALDDLMTCEALRHGIFDDRAALPSLMRFYDEFFLKAPVDRRREIYRHVAMIASQIGGWTAGAMTPFMLLDPDMGIVSTATIDYTSLGSLLNNDPMTRPKDAISMIEKGIPRNPAAVIGGLLALGDPRVCRLLVPLRASLDEHQVETVTKCFSGVTAKCVVEFYLDWLDELIDRRDYEGLSIFGHVAAGLYRLAHARSVPFISDGQRPFPVPRGEAAEWPDRKQIDPREFAASIASRILDLEGREAPPKVLPHAIRAFGLTPRTASQDIALMQ
jgi:hypothetical protein